MGDVLDLACTLTGIALARSWTYCSAARRPAVALVMSLAMNPGAMQFAVMPNRPNSIARVLVNP